MVFEKIKSFFRSIGSANSELTIRKIVNEWFIMDDGDILAGPYKTEGAAKGQRTRLLKGYTPASRRPNKG